MPLINPSPFGLGVYQWQASSDLGLGSYICCIHLLAVVYILHICVCDQICQRVLYKHSFRSHFLLSFDRYNNRLTVHACTIAKSSTVWFLLRPHSRACLASTEVRVVCYWLQLSRPGRQMAENHYRTVR